MVEMEFYMVLGLLCIATATAERILMTNYPMKSHTSELRMIGEELVRRGHEVYAILPPSFPGIKDLQGKSTVHYLTYEMEVPDMYTAFDNVEPSPDWMEELIRMTFLDDVSVYNVDPYFPILPFCTNALSDKKLFKQLQDLDFDLALIDGFMEIRCLFILPYKLGIPYVSQTTHYEPWLQRNPALPSFVPWPIGTGDYGYTEKMSFWQRMYNTYSLVKFMTHPGVEYLSDELVRKYAPEMPLVSIETLATRSLLWLMDTDVVIDFTRPMMPNMVEVGGLTTKPANPLPLELEEFVIGAEHGVIMASFGSLGPNLPKYISDRLMEAFSRVPQRVIWSYPHDAPSETPENVRMLSWIPQNDLLGHNNTKLFITHCGANSQFESLYHAVPMIAMPLFGDQPYNALRGEYFGAGIQMNVLEFTSDELVAAIDKVINGEYPNKIRKLSKIFRSRPMTPVERSAYWIEYVLEYGGEHLRSYALDMPWYEYMMLDILLFLSLSASAIATLILCCCTALFCHKKVKRD